jgi:hypothetical protein
VAEYPLILFYSSSFSIDTCFSHLFYEPVGMVYFSVSFVFIEFPSALARTSYFTKRMLQINYKGVQEGQSLRVSH